MKKSVAKIHKENGGWIVKYGKTKIRPQRETINGLKSYITVDSAQRAFRKFAEANNILDYTYSVV